MAYPGHHIPDDANAKVPELKNVLDQFPGRRLVIEIKPREVPPALITELGGLIREFGANNVLVASGWSKPLHLFREEFREIATSASVLEMMAFRYRKIRPSANAIQTMSKAWIFRRIKRSFIERANRSGLAVDAWTVNDEDEMRRLIADGIDGIITDHPTRLMKVLRRI